MIRSPVVLLDDFDNFGVGFSKARLDVVAP
jgi:hypothetical protein